MKEKTRVPKRKNSIETKQKIMAAAVRLFSEKGYHQTNSNEIAKTAGVAVGSFYAYYQDKKDVLLEIVKDHLEDAELEFFQKDIDDLILFTDTKEFVYSIIRKSVDLYNKDLKLHQMLNALQLSIPEIRAIYDEHEKRIIQKTVEVLSYYQDSLKVTNIEAAAFIISITIDTVIETIKDYKEIKNEKEYLQELVNMIYRYLFE